MIEKTANQTQLKKTLSTDTPLQNSFLQTLCREKVPVHIYLMNGIKLQGRIESFDCNTILLKNGSSQLVYKYAISTICLAENITLAIS